MSRAADEVDVTIEIPAGTRNKYEFDHELGGIRLTRRLPAHMVYPADYGFIPDTLSLDGDPLDVVVLGTEGTFPGCVIGVRPVGVVWTTDQAGHDPKIVGMLTLDAEERGIRTLSDLPDQQVAEVAHFFDVYKDLEYDKHSEIEGFGDATSAIAEIETARERFRSRPAH